MKNYTNIHTGSHTYYLEKDFAKYYKIVIKLLLSIMLTASVVLLINKKFFSIKTDVAEGDKQTFSVTQVSNIPSLKFGHYALWGEDKTGAFIFLKRFNALNNTLINFDGSQLTEITYPTEELQSLHITIEPEGDRNTRPSPLIFLSLINLQKSTVNELILTDTLHKAFKSITGTYSLATPTDGNSNINEESGVWFWDYAKNTSSLHNLPDMTGSNWTYKANIIYKEATLLPIGGFGSDLIADDYNRSSLQNQSGFNTPGEDFFKDLPSGLTGPINLTRTSPKIIITLDPSQSISGFPQETYFMPILEGDIPVNADTHANLPLSNIYLEPKITIQL